jgi:hypothetical protein
MKQRKKKDTNKDSATLTTTLKLPGRQFLILTQPFLEEDLDLA